MAATFTVEPDHAQPGLVSLGVTGQLDLAAREPFTDHLDRILTDGSATIVVVDLTGVDFVDSSGIGALVGGKLTADRSGRALRVRGVRGQVAEVFGMTGIGAIIPID